jgi:hypothetical protein
LIAILRLRQNCSDWAIDLKAGIALVISGSGSHFVDGKQGKSSYCKFSRQIKIISFKKKGAAEAAPVQIET